MLYSTYMYIYQYISPKHQLRLKYLFGQLGNWATGVTYLICGQIGSHPNLAASSHLSSDKLQYDSNKNPPTLPHMRSRVPF